MNTHLHPEAARLLTCPEAERRRAILSTSWIPYSRARRIAEKLDDLLHYPPSHRMPNLLVVGNTGNGKTVILRRFEKKYPVYTREEDGHLIWPVLYIQAPPEPDERRFYNLLLDVTGVPYRPADRVDRKQRQVINVLRQMETKLLIIDEIQHILAGNQTKQRQFLNVLKYLSNELMIPLACAGIGTSFNAIQHDEQLVNRFEPMVLPRWRMGEEYLRLLLSFEQLLPLRKPSNLVEEKLAYKLLSMSDGSIGELSKVLKKAAVQAIHTQEECISLSLLSKLDHTPSASWDNYYKLLEADV